MGRGCGKWKGNAMECVYNNPMSPRVATYKVRSRYSLGREFCRASTMYRSRTGQEPISFGTVEWRPRRRRRGGGMLVLLMLLVEEACLTYLHVRRIHENNE